MFKGKHKKPLLFSLVVFGAGLLIASFVFVYYGFHLGIKPCKGLPTDAANCGDADMGGVIFVVVGIPIALFGFVSTLLTLLMARLKPGFSDSRFVVVASVLLGVLLLPLCALFFG